MLNFNTIKLLIEEKNFTLNSFAPLLDMTGAGLGAALKKETLKVRDLEKIAEILKMDISDFFNSEKINVKVVQNGGGDNHNIVHAGTLGECQERVKGLEAMVSKQEKEIEFLRELLKSKS